MSQTLPAVINDPFARPLRRRTRADREAADRAGPAEHVRRALAVLRRRWLSFAAVFLFVLAGAAFYTVRQTPQFTATASLLVNSRVLNVAPTENEVVPTLPTADAAVNAEIQILQSNQQVERVVGALQRGPLPQVATILTELPPADAAGAVVGAVKGGLKISRPGDTNVLNVSFTAENPDVAAIVANEYAAEYLRSKSDTRLDAARGADVGLRRELAQMRSAVESAEAAVAQYRAANNLLSADGVTLTEQEISIYKQQDAAAQTTLAEERARLSTARSQLARGSKGDDVGEALSSPVVNGLRGQRAQVSAKLAELEARYQSGHPEVAKARSQLADIDSGIQSEISRVMSNLEARVQVAGQRASSARGIAQGASGTLAQNAQASVRLNELERRAEALRSNYAAMLQRQNAVATQTVVADEDARIFSLAPVPKHPSFPNRKLNMLIGALLATLLAGITVWLLHMFDRGISTSREAEEKLGLPHMVNIPTVRSIATRRERDIMPADFMLKRPLSVLSEAARSLLLAIDKHHIRGGGQIIGITSSKPGEGKSTLATILARTAAIGGRRTLLIDGDVRRPSISGILGLAPYAGLNEVLSGELPVEKAVLRDEISGAWVLPSVRGKVAGMEFMTEEAIAKLLAVLRKEFDVIVIDSAPALAAVEARLFMHHADVVLLAVRWNHTFVPVIRSALKRLAAIGVEPTGVVMTQVDMKAIAAYGYDDVDYEYRSYANYGQ